MPQALKSCPKCNKSTNLFILFISFHKSAPCNCRIQTKEGRVFYKAKILRRCCPSTLKETLLWLFRLCLQRWNYGKKLKLKLISQRNLVDTRLTEKVGLTVKILINFLVNFALVIKWCMVLQMGLVWMLHSYKKCFIGQSNFTVNPGPLRNFRIE